jgi:predicted dehydrogenase
MTDKVRVGVIGAGKNTRRRHIPGLQRIDGVRVTAVCNRSMESSRKAADEFGIPNVFENPEDLLRNPEIDAVVIGTWPYKHRDFTVAALEHGKHVLCEARMAMNSSEAQDMLKTAESKPGLTAQIVPAPMTLSQDDTVKELAGKIKPLTSVFIRQNSGSFPSMENELSWRKDRKYSGNNLMSVGIYYETVMRWTGGVSRVFADTKVIQNQARDPETGEKVTADVPDYAIILGQLVQDKAGFVMTSHSVSGIKESEIIISGFHGVIRVIPGNRIFFREAGETDFREVPFPGGDGWQVEEEFIRAVRGHGKINKTTLSDGLKYMRFTDAVHESSTKGCWITI